MQHGREAVHSSTGKKNAVATLANLKQTQILGSREILEDQDMLHPVYSLHTDFQGCLGYFRGSMRK